MLDFDYRLQRYKKIRKLPNSMGYSIKKTKRICQDYVVSKSVYSLLDQRAYSEEYE